MKFWKKHALLLAGAGAGIVNGLFGGGGGMLLVPMLTAAGLEETEVFPSSVAIILPICLVSLVATAFSAPIPWREALPYLVSGAAGGAIAALYGKKVPVLWLHRFLGILILWGGIRYLC